MQCIELPDTLLQRGLGLLPLVDLHHQSSVALLEFGRTLADQLFQLLAIALQLLFRSDDVIGHLEAHGDGQPQKTEIAEEDEIDDSKFHQVVDDDGGNEP